MVRLGGGEFLMGTDEPTYPADGESPSRPVLLDAFWIDETAVTNAAFAAFVGATGYRTDAERHGWSFVFGPLLGDRAATYPAVAEAPWWRQVAGADAFHPEGPASGVEDRMDHPVVHVSWNDAQAYCAWAGVRLPTEAEWECAARGGLVGRRFPWGDELTPGGEHLMNVWQGSFPDHNTLDDGHLATAPVRTYPPNGYGLYETTGNVWEWTTSRAPSLEVAEALSVAAPGARGSGSRAPSLQVAGALSGAAPGARGSSPVAPFSRAPSLQVAGALSGAAPGARGSGPGARGSGPVARSHAGRRPGVACHPGGSGDAMRVTKGGSYLCHASYCNRYRVAARSFNAVDDSTGNIGLRCVRDA